MRILVSDSDQSHANSMKAIIEAECPSATVTTYIEAFSTSVTYALANNFDIISRSTTGLTDNRNEGAGDTAWEGSEYTEPKYDDAEYSNNRYGSGTLRVGAVHSFGDNNNNEENEFPSYLDVICAVAGTDCNYGAGLEVITDDTNSSNACARVAGVIAQIMTDNPTWNFHDARQAIRQTCSNYSTGWVKETGFGTMDKTAAKAVTTLDMDPPTRVSAVQDSDNQTLTFSWKKSKMSGASATVITRYDSEPSRDDVPTKYDANILYNGALETYEWDYSKTDLSGTYYFAFQTYGSYSPIESFVLFSYDIETENLRRYIHTTMRDDELLRSILDKSATPYGVYVENTKQRPSVPYITHRLGSSSGYLVIDQYILITCYGDVAESALNRVRTLFDKQRITLSDVMALLIKWDWSSGELFDQELKTNYIQDRYKCVVIRR